MTGIPRDGWLAFGRAVEQRFLELGGAIRYGAKVERLETGDGAVSGVRLAGGETLTADRVLSAADGRFTRTVLLGEDGDARFDPGRVSDQPVQVNLGVAEDWSASGALTYLLPDAPAAAGRTQHRVTVQNKHYGPELHLGTRHTAAAAPAATSRDARSRAIAPVLDFGRRLPSMTRTVTTSSPRRRR